jgi:hypothetical protein
MNDRNTAAAPRRRIAAAAVTVMTLALCAAPAEAQRGGMKIAQFELTVTGTQANAWAVDQTEYDGCVDGDVHTSGAGRERLTFHTRRPARVEAVGIGQDVVLSAGNGGIPISGTIERQGDMTVRQLSGGESFCGGVPEPTAPPAPDCGVRPLSGTLDPVLYAPGDAPVPNPILQLVHALAFTGPDLPEGRHPAEHFANCPGSDALLRATDTAHLKPRDLFSRKRRIVVRGEDTVERVEDGYRESVAISWKAVLTRRGQTRHVSDRRVPAKPRHTAR